MNSRLRVDGFPASSYMIVTRYDSCIIYRTMKHYRHIVHAVLSIESCIFTYSCISIYIISFVYLLVVRIVITVICIYTYILIYSFLSLFIYWFIHVYIYTHTYLHIDGCHEKVSLATTPVQMAWPPRWSWPCTPWTVFRAPRPRRAEEMVQGGAPPSIR